MTCELYNECFERTCQIHGKHLGIKRRVGRCGYVFVRTKMKRMFGYLIKIETVLIIDAREQINTGLETFLKGEVFVLLGGV